MHVVGSVYSVFEMRCDSVHVCIHMMAMLPCALLQSSSIFDSFVDLYGTLLIASSVGITIILLTVVVLLKLDTFL